MENIYPVGTRVTYTCFNNYKRVGTLISTCEASGSWVPEPPRCISRKLYYLSHFTFINKISIIKKIMYTDNVFRVCVYFFLVFSGQGCRLVTPTHGLADAYRSPMENIYPVGTRVIYTCLINYKLVGSWKSTCQASGSWVPEPPRCISRKFYYLSHFTFINKISIIKKNNVYRQCLQSLCLFFSFFSGQGCRLVTPTHGLAHANRSPTENIYPVGTRVTYTCLINYERVGSWISICEESGSWVPEPPRCIPSRRFYY